MRLLLFALALLVIVVPADSQHRRKSVKPHGPTKQELNKRRNVLQTKISAKRHELVRVRRVRHVAASRLRVLDGRLSASESVVRSTREKLVAAKAEQRRLERRLHEARSRLATRRELLRKRLRARFLYPEVQSVTALLDARSAHELASRGDTLRRISAQDSKLFREYKALSAQLAEDAAAQARVTARIAVLQAQHEREAADLRTARQDKAHELSGLTEQQGRIEEDLNAMLEGSREIAAQLRALSTRPEFRARAQVRFQGRLALPNASITSGFGMRFHPIAHVNKMHTGIDFGLPSGAPIHAAADGVVVSAEWRRGYGNTIIIDHNGGIATLYGHCSAINVSVGQVVRQGDTIGLVGATGYTTGPHLHFEVRRDGTPVNPMSFR